jgi:hypothetical protein
MTGNLLHEIMSLVDKNSSTIPEGDYLAICDKICMLYKEVERCVSPIPWDPGDDDMVEIGSPIN